VIGILSVAADYDRPICRLSETAGKNCRIFNFVFYSFFGAMGDTAQTREAGS
jgi:hypothetical protein